MVTIGQLLGKTTDFSTMIFSSSSRRDKELRFLNGIAKDLEAGYWFVPFIGAGLSVGAGIPSAPELKRYLTYCFLRAAGVDPLEEAIPRSGPISFVKAWNPRQLSWPKLIYRSTTPGTPTFIENSDLDEALRRLMEKSTSEADVGHMKCAASSELLREMYGSLSDWRSALILLSRLSLTEKKTGGDIVQWLVRTVPETSVIDSFFTHLVEGRDPTLGHRMIHALSSVLRADVILTTNFDDLIEKSFDLSGTPLSVFEVPLNARLPVARLVHPQKSLIKLNGGRFGVRADYSTDIHPTRADRWHFLSYLAGRPLDRYTQDLPETKLKKKLQDTVALLFCGVSGEDDRTRALIDLAIAQFENLRIYWLCYTESDEQQAKRILSTRHEKQMFKILRHPDQGLFLMEIHQRCTNSLPTSGAIIPSLWQVAQPPIIPEPTSSDDADISEIKDCYKEKKSNLNVAIGRALRAEGNDRLPITLISEDSTRGAITLCSNLFYDDRLGDLGDGSPTPRSRRIWLNLDDVTEPVGLFIRLALVVAQISGDMDPISTLDLDDFYKENQYDDFVASVKLSLAALALKSGQRLIVFLNAQSGVGKVPMFRSEEGSNRSWSSRGALTKLIHLLDELSLDRSCGLLVVLLLRAKSEGHWQNGGVEACDCQLAEAIRRTDQPPGREPPIWLLNKSPCTSFQTEKAAKAILNHVTPGSKNPETRTAALFLYLLALFRIPRFPAALTRILDAFLREERLVEPQLGTETTPVPDLSLIVEWVNQWLTEHASKGGVRRKVGGLVWMDWEVKKIVYSRMLKDNFFSANEMLRLEWLVSRAYGRLLLASSDPLAAVECVHHTINAVEQFVLSKQVTGAYGWELLPLLLQHAELVFNTAKDLLKRRLSDQFADHSLRDMHTRCLCTIDKLEKACVPASNVDERSKSRKSENQLNFFAALAPSEQIIFRQTTSSLKRLLEEIVITRSDLYLLEGSFGKIEQHLGRADETLLIDNVSYAFQFRMDVATARLCLRDYDQAEIILSELWVKLYGKNSGTGEGMSIACAQSWLARAADCKTRKHMVLVARKFMYLRMHQSQARFLAHKVLEDTDRRSRNNERSKILKEALWYYAFALEILRVLTNPNDPFVFAENARLRSHAGLCYGVLALSHIKNESDFHKTLALAKAQLIDAECYVEEFPLKEGGRARAVLELRRAELQLIEAGAHPAFRRYRRDLRRRLDDPSSAVAVHGSEEVSPFRVHLVFDAMRSLQRAEAELKKQPKSRWWWWLLMVLRMKTCEYLYCNRLMAFESVVQKNCAPVEGDEYNISDAGNIPIVLTQFLREDLFQMLRERNLTDTWQLARITDSFAKTVFSMDEQAKGRFIATGKVNSEWRTPYAKVASSLIARLEAAMVLAPIDTSVRLYSEQALKTAQRLVERLSESTKH